MAVTLSSTSRIWPQDTAGRGFAMPVELVRELEALVLEGIKALPRRGLEISGLLLGSVDDDLFSVARLQPIASTYPEGPVFRVRESELRLAIAQVPAEFAIVGMYRSRTDDCAEMDYQDELLLRLLDTEHPPAILVVAQSRNTAARVRLAAWTDEGLVWSGESLWLSEWANGSAVASPHAAPREERPAPVPSRSPVPMPVPEHDGGRRRYVWAVCLAAAFGIAVASGVMMRQKASRPEASRDRREQTVVVRPLPATVVSPQPVPQQPPAVKDEPVHETPRVLPERPPAVEKATPVSRKFRYPAARPAGVRTVEAPRLLGDTPELKGLPASTGAPVFAALTAPGPNAGLTPVPQAVQFSPPSVARQSAPVVLPPDLRRMLRGEVVLSLRVVVDASGRVTKVVPVTVKGRTEAALVNLYAASIQSWTFNAAQRNGRPVAGETILTFRVSPDAL